MDNVNLNKNIDYFLNLDYDQLVKYLLTAPTEEKKLILKNQEIKRKLICPENRHEFSWLAQENSKDIIPYLLDGEGIEILKESEYLIDKMNAILTSNAIYVDTIVSFKAFQKIIFDNFDELKDYLNVLTPVSGQYLIKTAEKQNFNLIELISKFSQQTQTEVLKTQELSNEDYWKMISYAYEETASMLLEEKSVGKSLTNIRLPIIEAIASKDIKLPYQIIEEPEFIKRISEITDVKTYRFLVNDLEKSNDVEKLEKAREKYYENQINSFNKKSGMFKVYETLYEKLASMEEINPFSLMQTAREIFKDASDGEIFELLNQINKVNLESGLNGIKEILKEKSNIMLGNMIIDCHFKDYYLNVLKDVKQLCNFDALGGNALSSDKIEIYKKIIEINNLSYEEKLELNTKLGKKNYVEEFYDDVRNSRNKMYSLIREEILNEDKISKYLDKEETNKFGVNIYRLEGEPFFALVKSFSIDKAFELSSGDIHSYKDSGSFSIDASNKLDTFRDPKDNYNLIFNNFNIDQVVHMFPVDSFSGYTRGEKATDRVIELLTPKEFTGRSKDYNEVIIAQKNVSKPSDMDDRLPLPKPFAIYCYDEIGPNDIESAKNLGIGIVVVNTKKYNIEKNDSQISMFDTMSSGKYNNDLKYVNNKSQAVLVESQANRK